MVHLVGLHYETTLGTAPLRREVLMYKYRTLNMVNIITCTINCNSI